MRVRYNRGDIESTLSAAKRLVQADGKARFVYATAYGYTIATAPISSQSYYRVASDGAITLFNLDVRSGTHIEESR